MRSSHIKNSVIRDNIENDRIIELADGIRDVIDAPEFQRLRSIRQMGLSSYVFPTAEHSRFSHSLGVYATSQLAFGHLRSRAEEMGFQAGYKFDVAAERAFTVAALCHDIGHTAFSHVLESVLLPEGLLNHEECTLMLLSGNTEIREKIRNIADVDIDAVELLIKGTHPNKALADLISGALDVDRSDYLLRDSKNSGVGYGRFDLNWLLHAIDINKNDDGMPIMLLEGARGIDSLRQYLTARKHMHRQVYFHPTVRAAQNHLRGIFERIRNLVRDGLTIELPKCFLFLAKGRRPTIDEFLLITDVEVIFLTRFLAQESNDKVLKYLCHKFTRREFPKCVFDTARLPGDSKDFFRISLGGAEVVDVDLIPNLLPTDDKGKSIEQVTEALRDFVESELEGPEIPSGAGRYLVSSDPAPFSSSPPIDLKFRFGNDLISLENLVDKGLFGVDVHGMFESFTIHRMFVPDVVSQSCKDWLLENYGNRGS